MIGFHVPGAHKKDRITIDQLTVAVDQQQSIPVAVQGGAEVAAGFHHSACELFRVRRAAGVVDVASIGSDS